MPVTGQDVADFLASGDRPEMVALAGQHVQIVTAMARSYTRGAGFTVLGEPFEDVAAVITTATARLVDNPEQKIEKSVGPVSSRGGFHGWSLAETFVLNRYRKRAA